MENINWDDIHMHEKVIVRRKKRKWNEKVNEDNDSLVMGEWFKKK
jgi:hypothetical protein